MLRVIIFGQRYHIVKTRCREHPDVFACVHQDLHRIRLNPHRWEEPFGCSTLHELLHVLFDLPDEDGQRIEFTKTGRLRVTNTDGHSEEITDPEMIEEIIIEHLDGLLFETLRRNPRLRQQLFGDPKR